jgi:citrate lyase subunit alpha / citrate CoA-transferase
VSNDTLQRNAVGRLVPTKVNNVPAVPFQGVGKYRPTGRKHATVIPSCADYPADGNKLVPTLKEALVKAGLRDGVTISTHHHFRDGDLIANQIFEIAAELGLKGLVWAPSASFPCHKPIIAHLESGVVHHIEGSMNGDLGRFCSQGKMAGLGVLRSHGGRYQAIQDGELHIDIAVIAAPAADAFGNANGVYGKAACGSLGFSLADSEYADKVIVVTDNLMPFPCVPWQIQGGNVDYTVVVDQVGIPEKIISGTTQITRSPDRLLLAEMTARFCQAAGIIKEGFSFQAGAGGTSLAIGIYFAEILEKMGATSRFARGGSNKYLVEMFEQGLTGFILDGQTFDLEGVRSLRENANHVSTTPFTSYNYHGKGNFASMVDVAILGATEIDLNFNGNVVTHSDGYLLHGIGGWQNCLFAKCVILPLPLFRGRIPVIRDEVTTLCGPGELIDVIVTERGIAINPLRQDLLDAVKGSSLPIKTLSELKEEAERICGKPDAPRLGEEVVAAVKWVDGTVIDAVRQVMA